MEGKTLTEHVPNWRDWSISILDRKVNCDVVAFVGVLCLLIFVIVKTLKRRCQTRFPENFIGSVEKTVKRKGDCLVSWALSSMRWFPGLAARALHEDRGDTEISQDSGFPQITSDNQDMTAIKARSSSSSSRKRTLNYLTMNSPVTVTPTTSSEGDQARLGLPEPKETFQDVLSDEDDDPDMFVMEETNKEKEPPGLRPRYPRRINY